MALSRNELVFVGVDSWNRPVFKRLSNDKYYCSVDSIFPIDATPETINQFLIDALLYRCEEHREFLYYKGCDFEGEPEHPVKFEGGPDTFEM
ncbi:hypothetical protein ACP179_01800 (plasmid) [Xenorhabdus stockiae]|uniref:hypothetical protein n=1 Tax=Xenorhabdus stockiae TaxID=351614 RepID=UPI003CEB1800